MKDSQNFVAEYTPTSELRDLKQLYRRMVADLSGSFDLAYFLFKQSLNAQYRKSYFGFFWAVIPMLATATTFILLQSNGVFRVGQTEIPYPLFVISGILLWQTFLDSIQTPLRTLESCKPMLMKVKFPREALLLSSLYEIFFNATLRVFLILLVAVIFGTSFSAKSVLTVLGLFSLIGLGFSMSLFFAPLALLYQDLSRGLNVFSLFWMFATPVLYPAPSGGLISTIVNCNPVTSLLDAARSWLILGSANDLCVFLIITAVWIAFLPLGWVFYRICLSHNIARMGM